MAARGEVRWGRIVCGVGLADCGGRMLMSCLRLLAVHVSALLMSHGLCGGGKCGFLVVVCRHSKQTLLTQFQQTRFA